jgi:acyl-CoA synthetase (AMP-forming)/AMP-acid ligase II
MKAADLPLHYNAVHVLEHNLETRADKPALLSDERELTFAEVSAEVNQVGHALKGLGVRPGEMVALLTLDSAEWVTSFFGTLKVGAVHVGLNTLLTPKEFAYVLDDAKSRVLIVHEMLLDSIESARDESPWLEHVVVIGKPRRETDISYADWIAGKPTELEGTRTHREDFATLNYSSGTTGEPKGILHAHSDLPLTAKLWGENVLGLTENDRTFAGAKLFFTFGTGGNLIFPWSVGASCVLMAGPPRVAKNVLDTIVKSASSGTSPPCASACPPANLSPPRSSPSGRSAPASTSSTASARPRTTTSSSRTGPATSAPGAAASPSTVTSSASSTTTEPTCPRAKSATSGSRAKRRHSPTSTGATAAVTPSAASGWSPATSTASTKTASTGTADARTTC